MPLGDWFSLLFSLQVHNRDELHNKMGPQLKALRARALRQLVRGGCDIGATLVSDGYGMGAIGVRDGSRIGGTWVRNGYGVVATWMRDGHQIGGTWLINGYRVGATWVRYG